MGSTAGAGLAFTMPARRDVFFVASGGAIYLPQAGPKPVTAPTSCCRSGGRSFSVGVGTLRSSPTVSFGGVF